MSAATLGREAEAAVTEDKARSLNYMGLPLPADSMDKSRVVFSLADAYTLWLQHDKDRMQA